MGGGARGCGWGFSTGWSFVPSSASSSSFCPSMLVSSAAASVVCCVVSVEQPAAVPAGAVGVRLQAAASVVAFTAPLADGPPAVPPCTIARNRFL
eukprot:5897416-Prymnesium_polylepis.2